MKILTQILLSAVLLLGASGCISFGGELFKGHHARTVELDHQMDPGRTFSAETHLGRINITGQSTDTCRVVADIWVQAITEQLAKEIAEQIEVSLVSSDQGLRVHIDRPEASTDYNARVCLRAYLPNETNVQARTSLSAVNISDIHGSVELRTSYADINARSLTGNVDLHNRRGNIIASHIVGDINLRTRHGKISLSDCRSDHVYLHAYSGDIEVENLTADNSLNALVNTSDGDIRFHGPADYAGTVDFSAVHGYIRTYRPVISHGFASDDRIKGKIEEGPGTITLNTSFGNILFK